MPEDHHSVKKVLTASLVILKIVLFKLLLLPEMFI